MAEPHLLFERDGHVATVTLNRPEARNALSGEMLVRMHDAWVEIDEDPEIRVAIVTGAGGHFCAGADLKAMAAGHPDDEWTPRFNGRPRPALAGAAAPLPAAQAADRGRRGLRGGRRHRDPAGHGPPGRGGGRRLRRGRGAAGPVPARRQHGAAPAPDPVHDRGGAAAHRPPDVARRRPRRSGLIGHVVPDGQALAKARELADQIAANGPLAVQAVLRSLRESANLSEAEALANELELGWPVFASNDAKEGPKAFAEKRDPNFTGT